MVEQLPLVGDSSKIYLILTDESGVTNVYDEYIWLWDEEESGVPQTGKYELIGTTDQIDISGKMDSTNPVGSGTFTFTGSQSLTGTLTVGSDPTNNMEVATKHYVDSNAATIDDTTTSNDKAWSSNKTNTEVSTVNTKATNAMNTLNTLLSPQATVIYEWDFTSSTDPLVEKISGVKTATLYQSSGCPSLTTDGLYFNTSGGSCWINDIFAIGRYIEIELGETNFAGNR